MLITYLHIGLHLDFIPPGVCSGSNAAFEAESGGSIPSGGANLIVSLENYKTPPVCGGDG